MIFFMEEIPKNTLLTLHEHIQVTGVYNMENGKGQAWSMSA